MVDNAKAKVISYQSPTLGRNTRALVYSHSLTVTLLELPPKHVTLARIVWWIISVPQQEAVT